MVEPVLFAVNEPTLPRRGEAERSGHRIRDTGRREGERRGLARRRRPGRVDASVRRSGEGRTRESGWHDAWESCVLTAKLVRPNEPPGDTGLGEIDPVTVTGRVVGPVTRVHVELNCGVSAPAIPPDPARASPAAPASPVAANATAPPSDARRTGSVRLDLICASLHASGREPPGPLFPVPTRRSHAFGDRLTSSSSPACSATPPTSWAT